LAAACLWLLEPMAELSEPRLGNVVTSETSREPYESVPLNVESTYVAYRVGLQRRGFASGVQWIFFRGMRVLASDLTVQTHLEPLLPRLEDFVLRLQPLTAERAQSRSKLHGRFLNILPRGSAAPPPLDSAHRCPSSFPCPPHDTVL
jgi:hypothetical protein